MATTTTVITPDPEVFSFSGLGDIGEARNTSPRAEIVFKSLGEAVTVGAAGEDQRVFLQMILPRNYSYVMVDFFARLKTVDAADWNVVGELAFDDGADRLQSQEIVSHGTIDVPSSSISRIWCPCGDFLKALVIQVPGSSSPPQAIATISNAQLAGTVGTFNAYCRFLQYDVEQTHHVGVNRPLLTR